MTKDPNVTRRIFVSHQERQPIKSARRGLFVALVNRFLAANRRVSKAVEARLPVSFTRHLHTMYKYEVARLVNRREGQVVLDIGGGKECPFLPFVSNPNTHRIIAIDLSERELRQNRQLSQKIVADAAVQGFPFKAGTADVIVSRSVFEHLPDNTTFFTNCSRTLRPGGVVVHTFPCKFAPFSFINQILPNWISKRLIAYFHPQWQDECGFIAYYDRCYFAAVKKLLENSGFVNTSFRFRYYQAIYFDFLFPLYVFMLSYDLLIWLLGIRNMACAMLVTAELASPYVDEQSIGVS